MPQPQIQAPKTTEPANQLAAIQPVVDGSNSLVLTAQGQEKLRLKGKSKEVPEETSLCTAEGNSIIEKLLIRNMMAGIKINEGGELGKGQRKLIGPIQWLYRWVDTISFSTFKNGLADCIAYFLDVIQKRHSETS
ncbi:hypothetical protein RND71_009783 [Anisodus tanguticus]|uniref:Uncharacterized protein n=1 Tax=Anisodus tanguticus TaxID=243964 RepID=A0AAE1SJ37_9SOLA|nr:hypothetical protein RND71_009783 [Anisodus tanguticus]